MKIKWMLILMVLMSVAASAYSAPKANYGTDACTQLVARANALYKKGKLADAKVLYEQALATGDAYYAGKCREQLRIINTLTSKKSASPSPVFTISQDTVRINYLGGDYPIHVDGVRWKATKPADDDWCKIEVDRRTGIVKIYCSPNEMVDDRSTLVTIINGNGKKKTVKVINDGSPEILRSSAQNLVFTPDGETSVVDIDSNAPWNVSDVPAWLQAIKETGGIQFTAAPNEGNANRIAHVKVETPSRQEITINIIQNATLDSLSFNKNNLHFGPDGGDEYIHVMTNASDWKFGDFPHWCQLEKVDANTIRVHCTPNEPVDMPREASVNVTTGSQTLGINVFQDPKPMVQIIPTDGIGGRRISFGFSAGYLFPMIGTSASSSRIVSPVNYMLGPDGKSADYTSSGGFNIGAFADIRLYKNLYITPGVEFAYYKYNNKIEDYDATLTIPYNRSVLKGSGLLSFKEDYTMMTLSIPVMVSYRIPITKRSHIRVNAGPVVDFGLSSKLNISGRTYSDNMKEYPIYNGQISSTPVNNSTSSHHMNYTGSCNLYSDKASTTIDTAFSSGIPLSYDADLDASPYNRINFGLRFGAGYEYMGISLSIHYQWMVTNMANKTFWESNRWDVLRSHDEYHMTGYAQHNNLLLVTLGYTFRY